MRRLLSVIGPSPLCDVFCICTRLGGRMVPYDSTSRYALYGYNLNKNVRASLAHVTSVDCGEFWCLSG
jgi:hypothetical protein